MNPAPPNAALGATPSAAAEILTEGVFSSCQFVSEATARLGQLARQQMADKQYVLNQAGQRLGRLHPRRRFNEWLQRLDDLQTTLSRCALQGVRRQRLAWRSLSDRLGRLRPAFVLKQRREVLDQAGQRLREQVRHRLRETQQRLDALQTRLRLLGPEQVLARGYSITMDAASGKVLRAATEARQGQSLRTKLAQGEIVSRVDMNDEERRRKEL